MIPYFTLPALTLGPLTIHPYGALAAAGLFACAWVTFVRARQAGIPDPVINRSLFIAGLCGFVGAHLLHRALTGSTWEGASSAGGMLGAVVGLWAYGRASRRDVFPISEVLLQGMVAGWALGRLGCTLAHDHPGMRTQFFLAVAYPDGARHDLGFYEFLFTALLILPLMLLLHRRFRPGSGRFLGYAGALYGPFRFAIEFLRDSSVSASWQGLAPAQWAAIVITGVGVGALLRGDS